MTKNASAENSHQLANGPEVRERADRVLREATPQESGTDNANAGKQSERFRRGDRLRTSLDFQRVYDRKCRAGDGVLLIFALRNELGHARLGLSVSRRVGNAVRRGRWKRLIRESFRRSRSQIPGNLDLIVIPRPNVTPELASVRNSLIRLCEKLERQLNGQRPPRRQQRGARR